jgi:hypothetical protein
MPPHKASSLPESIALLLGRFAQLVSVISHGALEAEQLGGAQLELVGDGDELQRVATKASSVIAPSLTCSSIRRPE